MKTKKIQLAVILCCIVISSLRTTANARSLGPQIHNKLCWLNSNIITLLNNNSSQPSKTLAQKRPSIGFFSADLKFDGETLKFCEIGNGLYGVPLPSYSIINGKKELLYTPYWDLFWLVLSQFNIPVWYIGNQTTNGAKTLAKMHGLSFANINEFKSFYAQNYPPAPQHFEATKINDYAGILAYAGNRNFLRYKMLKNSFPNVLFVNDFDNLFLRNKDKIHEFFNCNELKDLRPHWKVCPHNYTPELAQKITTEIPAAYYVIKPSIGRKAKGVCMVEKGQLDQALKIILQKNTQQNNSEYKVSDWGKTKNQTTFIVEEYVPSKTIFYEGKPYDPTLRAAFVVYYEEEKIVATFFSCFWKKPPCSLDDNGSLTDKHITKSMVGCTTPGQEVEPEDLEKLAKLFQILIPKLYEKMLLSLT